MYKVGIRLKHWTSWEGYVDTREEAVALRVKNSSVVFKKVHKKGK